MAIVIAIVHPNYREPELKEWVRNLISAGTKLLYLHLKVIIIIIIIITRTRRLIIGWTGGRLVSSRGRWWVLYW